MSSVTNINKKEYSPSKIGDNRDLYDLNIDIKKSPVP